MQPLTRAIVDFMAITGFLLSASMTAGLVITFTQMESLQRAAVKRISGQITGAVEKELTGQFDEKLKGVSDSFPKQTGPAIPFAKP